MKFAFDTAVMTAVEQDAMRTAVGITLTELRRDSGLSRADVHTAGGPHPSFQSLLERGTVFGSMQLFYKLCKIYGCPYKDFLRTFERAMVFALEESDDGARPD